MWQAIDSGREYLGEYMPWLHEYPTEEAHTLGFKKRLFERDNFDRTGSYVVEFQNQLAGTMGFGNPSRDNSVDVGYWLREDLQSRVIMTRCVSALINMAIVEMGIHRIVIRAATANLSSRGIPERPGFVHEGTMRATGYVNGEYMDLEIYSMLDHEWLARSTNA